MRRLLVLLVAGCGPAFAPVTARVPPGHGISIAASLRVGTKPDGGGDGEGALVDGGYFWFMRDGDQQEIRIGANVNWIDECDFQSPDAAKCTKPGAMGQTNVPAQGVTVHVFEDGGYEYE